LKDAEFIPLSPQPEVESHKMKRRIKMITIPKFLRGLIGAVALICILGMIPVTVDAMGGRPPHGGGGGGGNSVPELSVGAASGAVIIIVGGTLVLLGRRRRNNNKSRDSEKQK
jgi:hypothetical protein